MTLTLLIDLDDTLLNNNIDHFLPAYLKALGSHMAREVSPDLLVPKLLAATNVMLKNNSARQTLEEAFDQAFYPAIGRPKDELREGLERFYEQEFPKLDYLTSRRPAAIEMVKQALSKGHQVCVATNPLFPRQAILHRLNWAGLDPKQVPFSIITSFEKFHFAKPQMAFLTEIMAQLGWPGHPAVMIGNSLSDDLVPAARLGMPVFWVMPDQSTLPDWFHPLSSGGTLEEVPSWLEKIDSAGPQQEFATALALLARLKSTPAAIDTIGKELTSRQWQDRPQQNEWSLTEIICHLRDVDKEVNIPRFETIIQGNNPFVPGINTDPWANERGYLYENGAAALREYIEVRSRILETLEALPEDRWNLPARHAIFGPTTLAELVSFVATHDRNHIQQILATIQCLS